MKRKDAKKVKDIDGLHNILIDLKPRRCDSDVYINQKIDMTNLVKFIEKKKKENKEYKITYFHAIAMAFAKVFYNKKLLNRFICDRTTYERTEVVIAFVAKIAFDDKSDEVMINIKVDKDDNIYDISRKISEKVNKIRNSKETKKENTNNLISRIKARANAGKNTEEKKSPDSLILRIKRRANADKNKERDR